MDNHAADFDFRSYSCAATSAPPSVEDSTGLRVRFLGVSGLYLEWQGVGLLTTPYFSRASLKRVAFGRGRWDDKEIAAGMAGVPGPRIAAILTAHSHHDHLFDLPIIARQIATEARLYLNPTGAAMLAPYPDLLARAVELELEAPDWVWLADAAGARLPIRVLALPSPHARQAPGIRWADGEVAEPWQMPWEETRLKSFESGQPMALVIDLMAPGVSEPRWRIYFQDAATSGGGLTPIRDTPALGDRPVDLAVLCMASHHLAAGFPQELLEDLEPRHVVVTHYEDFFRSARRPFRFAPLLSDRRANDFLEALGAALSTSDRPPLAPASTPCGPATARWTMPVPGEWFSFALPHPDASPRGLAVN